MLREVLLTQRETRSCSGVMRSTVHWGRSESSTASPARIGRAAITSSAPSTLFIRAFGISETCYRYQARLSGENTLIADWLLRLTENQRNWGFGLCFLYLRNVKRFGWNHK